MNSSLTKAAVLRAGLLAALVAASTNAAAAARLAQAPAQPAAAAAPEVVDRIEPTRCSGAPATPAQLALQMGRSTMLRLPEAVQNRAVGNPGVVQAMLVAPDTLYIAGVDVGTTNMIVQGKSGTCSVVDITVAMDPAALQATLASVMPEEKDIKVLAAADALVLTGTVSDAAAVARAVELATAYVRRPLRPVAGAQKLDNNAQSQAGNNNNSGRVVNMLAVSAPQQVQLEVKIAEVSKTLLDRLEAGATLRFGSGSWAATLLSNFISGSANGLLDARRSNGKQQFTLEADKQDGVVRVLAEPNVMAISGQEGSFLAGGKFYIPVPQDNGKISMEEKEFGVGLRFTPTVLAGGRINLRVAPEVSELSREGIAVSAAGTNGVAILPALTTRKASTTVQLYDGQSFAIGGLIKNNLTTSMKGLPLLGEMPVLGALFRSADYQQDRTELVFVITARLVKPQASTAYVLPTDKVGVPSRGAVLLGGRLEGPAPDTTTAAASTPPASAPTAQSAGGFELK
ncbi:type II and III secretion system protein family protein [Massilia solisilvae]|uniref:Type II and III secretion system protein family protein n=1 Tax=Massilia solisilvae TaxID=1811225 RepID=A0ABT2BND1_9BURK|nr:type II and III secretion system protein family protein [Massilia solisilvae]MCS0610030.1 type II and III secretion system protein family protein [Massilia solisilvae]